MKIYMDRDMLIDDLAPLIPKIAMESAKLDEIITHLKQYNIPTGTIMSFINNRDSLENARLEELVLFAEQIHIKLFEDVNWIQRFLFDLDIEKLRTYRKKLESEERLTLPLKLENAMPLDNNLFAVNIPYTLLARMYDSGLLNYNTEIQREAKKIKSGKEILEVMNINYNNVKQITQLAKDGRLFNTTLYYNCRPESPTGDELTYDGRSRSLIIKEGTNIDILDGTHRTIGIYKAYMDKEDLEGSMLVVFSRSSQERVKRFQVDLAKATPISRGRIKELASDKQADIVVKSLKDMIELRERITSSETVKYSLGEIVTYSTLSNAIQKYFEFKKPLDVDVISDCIKEYMKYLFSYYSDQMNSSSMLFRNKVFVGHMYLAAKMKENNIPYRELRTYLDKVDFSRDADVWKEHKVIVDGVMSRRSERGIVKIFEEIIWGVK